MIEGALTLSDLIPSEQIRLAEISVYNWGPFNGVHTARFNPEGTLITGETGAGKSSLIDALQLLFLQPSRATFNTAAAQNDRQDRSLMTYVRGKYRAEDVEGGKGTGGYSRRGGATSAARALFKQGDRQLTFIALFSISNVSTAHDDIHRFYITATRDVQLTEVLEHFASRDKKALRLALKGDESIRFHNTFSEYEPVYRDHLHFENRNAAPLLSRALGLKKVENLTTLIQELVLDPGNIRELAATVVSNFNDLKSIHAEMEDARKRRDLLSPLPAHAEVIQTVAVELELLGRRRVATPVYLAREWARLWASRERRHTSELDVASTVVKQAKAALEAAKGNQETLHALYLKAGGGQIELLKERASQLLVKLTAARFKETEYQAAALALGLGGDTDRAAFETRRQAVRDELEAAEESGSATRERWLEARSKADGVQRELNEVQKELDSAKARPESNVPNRYDAIRKKIAAELKLDAKDLPYIAELIDVQPQQGLWRPAIERALGGMRITLLLSDDVARDVTSWINDNFLGIDMFAREVGQAQVTPEFTPRGYLRKLDWRDHPYKLWLQGFLSRSDLLCANDVAEMRRTPNSMTQQGLIHRSKGLYEKRDQKVLTNPEDWYLGFSNAHRVGVLSDREGRLRKDYTEALQQAQVAEKSITDLTRRANHLRMLVEIEWETIDVVARQDEYRCAKDALDLAQAMSGELSKAERAWKEAGAAVSRAEETWQQACADERKIDDLLSSARTQFARRSAEGSALIDEDVMPFLVEAIGVLHDEQLENQIGVEREATDAIRTAERNASLRLGGARESATKIITQFADKWGDTIGSEWGRDITALPDYVAHYESVVQDGLPELVERFQRLLNTHATQSLQSITERMRDERENIRDRIESINRVMERTELRHGTFLELEAKLQTYETNRVYEEKLQRVMNLLTSEDHEARFEALRDVVATLEKAIDPQSAGTKESIRLLDPRYQFDFIARELRQSDRQVVDLWTSSSGKSGGEKESFAGTIVAASLAYVLTPDGSPQPVYATVILDEAFSNTSVAFSRRVLRAFRALGLHLNLITPFKNIELAREHARSIVLVTKAAGEHASELSEISWEYVDRMHAKQDAAVAAEAAALGIELERD